MGTLTTTKKAVTSSPSIQLVQPELMDIGASLVTSFASLFLLIVEIGSRQAATIIDSGTAEHSKVVGIVPN